jgi:acetyl/propionyl-CoA carboxylase alpha subunit
VEKEFKVNVSESEVKVTTSQGAIFAGPDGRAVDVITQTGGSYLIKIGHRVMRAFVISREPGGKELTLSVGGKTLTLRVRDSADLVLEKMGIAQKAGSKVADLKSPMPGLVRQIMVQEGEQVQKGTPLMVLEAMKMENILKAQGPATVKKIEVGIGQAVEKGAMLIRLG